MRLHRTWLVAGLAFGWAGYASAQLQLVPDREPQQVFAGNTRTVTTVWQNHGTDAVNAVIRVRMLQNSSATAIRLGEVAWKRLQVLPGQTVLETAQLDFPLVKAETKFLVQWLEGTNRVLGKTEVLVYPTNLLAQLKPLADGEALGVFDQQNQLKPLLKSLNIEFVNLENSGVENFSGRLAIVGPFQSIAQVREGLLNQIQALAKKGAAIVWLQPPPEPLPQPSPIQRERKKLQPSFYSVSESTNTVIVVQPDLVADLPDNPQSQLNLIYLCKLALQPETFHFPNLTTQP